ncbi:D-alanine--D-alanine ligase A [bioreactor metagenome]|uniref:D-alanine--D-alanine ligase A n=1 Tax=bioreactor metagenome TaxID=1076179 RepID=A0A645JFD4_9ZZZZ
MEIVFDRSRTGDFNVYSYKVKQNYKEYVEYECPSSLDKKTEDKMMKIAAKVYASLGCRDMSRMDFRLSEDGEIFFIEINPLPGLAPGYSDFPMLCEFCGMDYDTLIYEIFLAAAKRYGFVGEARR